VRRRHDIATGPALFFILNHPVENNHWLIWQLADSAFPSGGFAHSGGLEAAWQHGEIGDSSELASFLESSLWQIASGMIPFVKATHGAPDRLAESDELCDAFLSNHVANRASRLQGRAFLNSVVRIFGSVAAPEADLDACHLAPVFGAVTCSLAVNRSTAADLFMFQSLRGLVAAAVRLGVVGPMEGQALQYRLAPRIQKICLTVDRPADDVVSVAPLIEIWQGSHDRLYSRLFQT
jgi:urease accessory protein